MFDIGFWELLLIGVMALLVLGPKRLPGAVRSTLKTFRSVKQTAVGFKTEMEEQLRIHELHEALRQAEAKGFDNLDPDLAKSVDALKAAAASVDAPYRPTTPEPDSSPESPSAADTPTDAHDRKQ